MDSDTAVNVGAVTTISGLLVLLVKWMIDSESKKIDEVLDRQAELMQEMKELKKQLLQGDEE